MNDTNTALSITPFASFYKSVGVDGTRYYGNSPQNRNNAREYSVSGDPVLVQGFAVYDSTVTVNYAVALYSSMKEAETHLGQEAPAVPDAVFEDVEPAKEAVSKGSNKVAKQRGILTRAERKQGEVRD